MTITTAGPRPALASGRTPTLGTRTTTVADYLGQRLLQLGVEHLFGVPGDFNLTLLDRLGTLAPLRWVGFPNELGAGYAADAYARSRGLAALVTTYGVGELSCLNAIAGSAAEDVAVVHVVGAPATTTAASGALVHHTLADGIFDRFERAYAPFTAMQQTLTAERAGAQIDAVLLAAITRRQPVYLSVPQDLADAPVDSGPLAEPLVARSDPVELARLERRLGELLAGARRPVLVLGHLVARFGLRRELTGLMRRSGIEVLTQLSAKGVVDEDEPLHLGDYAGTMTGDAAAALVHKADLVLHLGTTLSDVLTGQFTHRAVDDRTVQLHARTAQVGAETFDQVLFPDAVRALARVAGRQHRTAAPALAAAPPAGAAEPASAGEALSQAALWRSLQDWLPAGSALLADTGTAFWGAVSLRLPADTVLVTQPVWNSIGYALPAVVGHGLADPSRRPVLVVGDGAAQMTVADLGSIAAAGVPAVVVLLNNHGYTIERALQSPEAAYNDVARWDWELVLRGLAGPTARHLRAETVGAFARALRVADAHPDGLVLIEAELDAHDAPPLLLELARRHQQRSAPTPALGA